MVERTLESLIQDELQQTVSSAAKAVAEELVRRHGAAVSGCLFYGSCLRDQQDSGRLLDFYLLVDDYRAFHGRWLPAALNALLPPNVYYFETGPAGSRVRAKYAVLSLADLEAGTGTGALLPTLWGRLAQPCALVVARDATVAPRVCRALASAVRMLIGAAWPLLDAESGADQLWIRALRESYRTELRAERANRAERLFQAYQARYEACAALVLPALPPVTAGTRAATCRRWWLRRRLGKLVQVLRLCKAAYTFTDGLDYVLWKIEQHSGVRAEPSAWQRRHPLLAAPLLAWRLYRRRAFR